MALYKDIEDKFKDLKKGDLLIFTQNSGVLTGRPGDVITFDHFKEKDPESWHVWKTSIRCKELLETGNTEHNFCLSTLDFFTPEKYPKYRFLNKEVIENNQAEFIKKYGWI